MPGPRRAGFCCGSGTKIIRFLSNFVVAYDELLLTCHARNTDAST
jgi:hypothetical protein